jgi:ribonucleoside-diphosphate reductase alpha chain
MVKTVFSNTALSVLERRYLNKDEEGNIVETPEELFRRVASAVARDNQQDAEQFFNMMYHLDFLPNSPTLMNAGNPLGMLSGCFVIPIDDSIESIFDGIKFAAMIHKSGGGTGFSFSRLRPSNDTVKSTSGVSSGPISFMSVYDSATETIKQGGKRRGANMGILHVNHPDIEEFIKCKNDLNRFQNFNISVAITDEFMQAVEDGSSIALVNPRTKEVVKHVNAKELFTKIVESSYTTGEPGIVFIDAINRGNPTPHLGEIESTNPCGEQPLLPFESCNLGSINLSHFVNPDGKIDWQGLNLCVEDAVRFLDNVIDINKYPLEQVADMTRKTRKIGLGVMGFADMLIKMKVPYTARKALRVAEEVMEVINRAARDTSIHLAETFGPYNGRELGSTESLRNATRTTIAPTGTISIIAGCSSGIEPLFALAFKRKIMGGEEFSEIHPLFEEAIKPNLSRYKWNNLKEDLIESGKLTEDMIERYNLKEFLDPEVFVTAHDVSPDCHLKIQAAFQKYTDNAVSKTINLPKESTAKDVSKIYLQAWKMGLKGVTIYRDGSRAGQVLSTGKTASPKEVLKPRERPETINGKTTEIKTGCGGMLVNHSYDTDGNLFEVVATIGRGGDCRAASNEVTGRLISLALRSGIPPQEVIKQLKGIRCPNNVWAKGKQILSCPDAIGQVLEQFEGVTINIVQDTSAPCPDCGGTLTNTGGCDSCPSCGFSKCK